MNKDKFKNKTEKIQSAHYEITLKYTCKQENSKLHTQCAYVFAQLDGFEWTRFTAYTDVQKTSPTLTNPFFSGDLSKSDVK